MKTYLALVHKDPDSAWGVSFPDLPGCHSAADDFGDLLANAAEALALWFEDADPVEPRDLAAIREALAEAGFPAAMPAQNVIVTQAT